MHQKILKNTVAMVTGATGGIGLSCAKILANYGADLALHTSKNEAACSVLADELKCLGIRTSIWTGDFSKSGEAGRTVKAVADEFGPLTILIHAAGSLIEKPLAFTSRTEWNELLTLHTTTAYELAQAAIRGIRREKSETEPSKPRGGRIVFIGSLAGQIGSGNSAAYAATKGALHGLAKTLALEFARWSTTVNVVAPGYVNTPMTSAHSPERRNLLTQTIPLSRYGSADEIAALAAWLCLPEAAYLTGQVIGMDGGLSLR